MSIYFLSRNVTAAQSGPASTGSQVVQPNGQENPNTPSPGQQFQLSVSGIGAIDATAQILGSNDFTNYQAGNFASMAWTSIGSMTANGNTTANAGLSNNTSYTYFGSYISSIGGTGASATVTMSA